MRVPKGFSGILLIKRVWDGSFIIHYEDDYTEQKKHSSISIQNVVLFRHLEGES